jgi:hypothetical protein
LQFFTVRPVKALPEESATSKYSPDEEKLGEPTGSEAYCATVSAPTPLADAVVPSLVAVAVPVELDDVPLAELIDPDGAGGGVGDVGAGAGAGAVVVVVVVVVVGEVMAKELLTAEVSPLLVAVKV